MKAAVIRVINKDVVFSFRDTTNNKEYNGFIVEPYDLVPEGFKMVPGQKNDGHRSVAFFDDVGDDVAVNFDGLVDVAFEIVSEE